MLKGIWYSIASKEFFLKVLTMFLTIFGGITVILKPLVNYFPNQVPLGLLGMGLQLTIALITSIIINFPTIGFTYKLTSPNTKVTIKIGDLIKEPGHLVIGMNDVFDTEIGDIIKGRSIQGQFLNQIYNSDQEQLDRLIENELKKLETEPEYDENKNKGKRYRYPIGTTVTIGNENAKYFLSAYSYMGNDLMAQSSLDNLWHSLNSLWQEIRVKGQGNKVSMGIIGSGLARIPSARKDILIKLIVLSFVFSSKEKYITDELVIVIHNTDLEYINMIELKNTLKKLCY
ncbi:MULTISPECIES: macro domain-containing protein [Bacillus cereus group]|uniref:macro domain-containing protein n=1 Tax=Bacillus cereus group TaxID=86661 RepID=UPI001F56ECA2|nr:hypothetical protein [Bacillus cereus]